MFVITTKKIIYSLFKLTLFLSVILISIAQVSYGASIKIERDANTEEDLAGYKVYYGTSSGNYGSPIDVGNVTQYEIFGLN